MLMKNGLHRFIIIVIPESRNELINALEIAFKSVEFE